MGPSPAYLANVAGALTAVPTSAPNPDPFGLGLAPAAPTPQGGLAPPPPGASPYLAQVNAGMSVPPPATPQVNASMPDPVSSSATASPPPNVMAGPPSPSAAPAGASFPLVQTSGGGVANLPAKETEMRGPQLLAAQRGLNDATDRTIDRVQQRSVDQAAVDASLAAAQATDAYARQDAGMQSAVARDQELQQRQADFDSSVKTLSKLSLDPDRFWSTRSTGQKIAATISLALGGFLQGARGGSNPGQDMLNTLIDRDIKAQEFAYNTAKDAAGAKQTAFALAMQKYQNVDAARAAARAASLDAVSAQLQQQAAQWKGVDAQNHADAASAALMQQRAEQIQQGVAFTPARQVAVGRTWVDPATGIHYDENQARGLAGTLNTQGFELGKQQAAGENDLRKAFAESSMKGADKADEGTKYVSEKLVEAGIPQARAIAEATRKALTATPLSTNERVAGYLTDSLSDNAWVHKKIFSKEAQEREDSWENFKLHEMRDLAGPRGIGNEAVVDRLNKILDSAGDQESRLAAIKRVEEVRAEQEKTIRAGASAEAQRQYDRQRGGAETGGALPAEDDPLFKAKK